MKSLVSPFGLKGDVKVTIDNDVFGVDSFG